MNLPRLDPRLTGRDGFKNFLYLVWTSLPAINRDPTPLQYDIAEWVANGPRRRGVEGFRGVGKSYISAAYADWRLLLDPALNVLIVSAAKGRADRFSKFMRDILRALGPLTKHLEPREGQYDSIVRWDVGPKPVKGEPSVMSVGLTGSNTGTRAGLIICDDVCSLKNMQTQVMRDRVGELLQELDGSILMPGGDCLHLYTMQTEEDPTGELPERGFQMRVFPARVPDGRWLERYGHMLSPYIQGLIDQGVPEGTPTEPTRFPEEELIERELREGRHHFALHFLCDHSLADHDRYPLKITDLVVMDVDRDVAPEKVVWSSDPRHAWRDLPCVGFKGDRFFQPLQTIGHLMPYQGKVMAVDPSGRGADETAFAIVGAYGGQLFLQDWGGMDGGYGDAVLNRLALLAQQFKVPLIWVEENFGQGMFASLLRTALQRVKWPCEVEEIRSSVQKERRICDTLEPVLNAHKLVVDRGVVERDYRSTQHLPAEDQRAKMGLYQLSRITRVRGCLRHDDRIDALALAVQYWVEAMAQDTDREMEAKAELIRDEMYADFMRSALGVRPAPLVWADPFR